MGTPGCCLRESETVTVAFDPVAVTGDRDLFWSIKDLMLVSS